MAYFKINGVDYSQYVNKLKISTNKVYSAQTNAAGDTVADYINSKRTIEVGIIPLEAEAMAQLLSTIDAFNVSISFRNPITKEIEENVDCIIPTSGVEYYTIQVDKVMYKAFSLKITEL